MNVKLSDTVDISVLMITYNHSKFIAEAIESVLAQRTTYSWELVIGDDGSTDGAQEIINRLASTNPDQIRLLPYGPNIGMIANFERTKAACRGRYIAFLEGDDYWFDETKLQKQIDQMESDPTLSMTCGSIKILKATSNELVGDTILSGNPRRSLLDLLRGNFVATCTAVVRAEALCALPAEFSTLGLGDWPQWFFAAQTGDIFCFREILAVYNVHSGGVWSGARIIEKSRSIEKMFRLFRPYTKNSRVMEKARWEGLQLQRFGHAIEAFDKGEFLLWFKIFLMCAFSSEFYISPKLRFRPLFALLPQSAKSGIRLLSRRASSVK